jgi:uncharacterized protein (DUF1499 family)
MKLVPAVSAVADFFQASWWSEAGLNRAQQRLVMEDLFSDTLKPLPAFSPFHPPMLKSLIKPLLTLGLALVLMLTPAGALTAATIALPPPAPLIALFAFAGKRPAHLGLQNGQFVPCASTPNCVNSQATDTEHQIDPIRYSTTPEKAWALLKQAILETPRTTIVTATPDYLYAEFTSKLMGFVDDVEFHLNPEVGVIEVRSASRLGESDLGVNRQRVEALREKLRIPGDIAAVKAE